jgi:hypothetical protein
MSNSRFYPLAHLAGPLRIQSEKEKKKEREKKEKKRREKKEKRNREIKRSPVKKLSPDKVKPTNLTTFGCAIHLALVGKNNGGNLPDKKGGTVEDIY